MNSVLHDFWDAAHCIKYVFILYCDKIQWPEAESKYFSLQLLRYRLYYSKESMAWQQELETETAYFIHTQEAQSESFQEVQQVFTPLQS